MVYCAVASCGNVSSRPKKQECLLGKKLRFFSFPRASEPERQKEWAMRCGRTDLLDAKKTPEQISRYKVCSNHFVSEQFCCVSDRDGSRLLHTAIPSLNLRKAQTEKKSSVKLLSSVKDGKLWRRVPDPVPDEIQTENEIPSSSTDGVKKIKLIEPLCVSSADESDDSDVQKGPKIWLPAPMSARELTTVSHKYAQPQFHKNQALQRQYFTKKLVKMRKNLRTLKCQLRESKSVECGCFDGVPPALTTFIQEQTRVARSLGIGHEWSSQTKAFSLALYLISPSAYRLVAKLLALPTVKILKQYKLQYQNSAD